MRNKQFIYGIVTLFIFLSAGCVTTSSYKVHSSMGDRLKNAKTVAIMPVDVKIYKVTAGGVAELMDEWSDEAKDNIFKSVKEEISNSYKFNVNTFPETSSDKGFNTSLKDMQALYRAVNYSIFVHLYVPEQVFPDKVKNFDYTLGPGISTLAQSSGSDTLLFIQCQNYLSTGGRVAMKFFAALLGTYLQEGFNYISASLVDGSTGEILWYNIYWFEEYDIRNPEKAKKLVKVILKGFPDPR